MKSLLKNRLKEQKGFTLIELLAVIVILGIILAIAIPAVGSLINNSRIDAHISNAQQLEASAKLYFAEYPTDSDVTYGELLTAGLIEPMEDPHGTGENKTYSEDDSKVVVADTGNRKTYTVTLASYGGHEYYSGPVADFERDEFTPAGD